MYCDQDDGDDYDYDDDAVAFYDFDADEDDGYLDKEDASITDLVPSSLLLALCHRHHHNHDNRH